MNFVDPIKLKKDINAMKKYLRLHNYRDFTLFVFGINSALRVSDLLNLQLTDIVNEDGSIKDRVIIKEQKTSKNKNFPLNDIVKEVLSNYFGKVHNRLDSSLFPSREWFNGEDIVSRYSLVQDLYSYISDIEARIKEYQSIKEIINENKQLNFDNIMQSYRNKIYSKIEDKVNKEKHTRDKQAKIDRLSDEVPKQVERILKYKGHDPITRQTVHIILKEASQICKIEENISTHSLRKTWARNVYDRNIKTNPGILYTIQKALNHSDSSTTLRYIGISQRDVDYLYMLNAL